MVEASFVCVEAVLCVVQLRGWVYKVGDKTESRIRSAHARVARADRAGHGALLTSCVEFLSRAQTTTPSSCSGRERVVLLRDGHGRGMEHLAGRLAP